jgi:hypothetical protein
VRIDQSGNDGREGREAENHRTGCTTDFFSLFPVQTPTQDTYSFHVDEFKAGTARLIVICRFPLDHLLSDSHDGFHFDLSVFTRVGYYWCSSLAHAISL